MQGLAKMNAEIKHFLLMDCCVFKRICSGKFGRDIDYVFLFENDHILRSRKRKYNPNIDRMHAEYNIIQNA